MLCLKKGVHCWKGEDYVEDLALWIAIAFEILIWITMELLLDSYLNYCYLDKVISDLVFVFEFLRSWIPLGLSVSILDIHRVSIVICLLFEFLGLVFIVECINKAAENYYPNFSLYSLIQETDHLEYDQITIHLLEIKPSHNIEPVTSIPWCIEAISCCQ